MGRGEEETENERGERGPWKGSGGGESINDTKMERDEER